MSEEHKEEHKLVKKIVKKIIKRVVRKPAAEQPLPEAPPPIVEAEIKKEEHLGMADMFSRLMDGKNAFTEEEIKHMEERKKQEEEKKQQLAEKALLKAHETHAVFDESGWGGYFFDFSSAGFLVICEHQIIHLNKRVLDILHYRFKEEVLEKRFLDFIVDEFKSLFENSMGLLLEEHKTIEIKLLGNGNRKVDVVVSARMVKDDNYFTYLVEIIDITEIKRLEEKLTKTEELLVKASGYDSITQLPERKFFDDRLEKIIARSLRFNEGKTEKIKTLVAIFIIDIDGFSKIEQNLGKVISEKLLAAIAIRLLSSVDEADTVAKNQGDQFLLILEGFPNSNRIITTVEDIKNIAEHLLKTMQKPLNVMGEEITVKSSIGISYFPKHGRNPLLLLRTAQSALDVIKSSGGNQYLIAG